MLGLELWVSMLCLVYIMTFDLYIMLRDKTSRDEIGLR